MAYDLNNGSGAMYHRLTLEGREKLTVGGVEDVARRRSLRHRLLRHG